MGFVITIDGPAASGKSSVSRELSKKLNIPWGKPEGVQYRKYFIERPFSFTKLIVGFLNESKRIQCINPDCKKEYSIDQLKFLEFNNFKCNVCSFPVEIKSISGSSAPILSSLLDERIC